MMISEDSTQEATMNKLFFDYKYLSKDPAENGEYQHGGDHKRKLNFRDGVAIVVGIIIGSGIFSSPGLALERSGSGGMDLIAWSASGILVMLASQCYLELGGMMPSAGGDFDYITKAWGDRMGFAFAWFNFFVGKTGSQAIIATIFGRYFSAVINGSTSDLKEDDQSESSLDKILAISLIIFITCLNCAGIKESALVSIVLTSIKVILVLSVFVFSAIYATSKSSRSDNFIQNLSPNSAFDGSNGIIKFSTSMVACLWCFDGYADGNYLQEEMVNPVRDLPRILRVGLTLVTLCYILINIGYLTVLSKDTIIDSNAIAVEFGDTVSQMFSTAHNVLPTILALGVSLSTMGSINGSIMTGGRAFFAVARAGKFPAILAKINSRGAPWVSLLAQAVWSIVLILLPGSSFSSLLDYFGPTSWLFYAITASSVIILRLRDPDAYRPFRVNLYPLPPLIVILIALVIFISSLASEPLFTLLAIGFVLLSFPVHYIMEQFDSKTREVDQLHLTHSPLPSEEDI